jgi:thioredoxin-like negative regulator of GroEL
MKSAVVRPIRPDNFEQEFISEEKPLLVLCMPRSEEFAGQIELLESIGARYGEELIVGVLDENSIETFKRNYRFAGTPTFLVLVKGKERGRMLGLADQETLMELIQSCVTPHGGGSSPNSKVKV